MTPFWKQNSPNHILWSLESPWINISWLGYFLFNLDIVKIKEKLKLREVVYKNLRTIHTSLYSPIFIKSHLMESDIIDKSLDDFLLEFNIIRLQSDGTVQKVIIKHVNTICESWHKNFLTEWDRKSSMCKSYHRRFAQSACSYTSCPNRHLQNKKCISKLICIYINISLHLISVLLLKPPHRGNLYRLHNE